MKFVIALPSVFFLAGLGAGGCGLFATNAFRLHCKQKYETSVDEYYCVNPQACQGTPGYKLLCSWAKESDDDHEYKYDDPGIAANAGECDGSEMRNIKYPKNWCDGSEGGGGNDDGNGDEVSSAPTTGSAEPTTTTGATSQTSGEDSGTGTTEGDNCDESNETKYFCSLLSDEKCADISVDSAFDGLLGPDPYPTDAVRDACWVPIEEDPVLAGGKISYCVDSAVGDPVSMCQDNCNAFNDFLDAACAPNKLNCTVITHVDCSLTDTNEVPVQACTIPGGWKCYQNGVMLQDWDTLQPLIPLEGSAALVLSDGSFTALSDIGGILSYEVNNCLPLGSPTSCTITVSALESMTRHFAGNLVTSSSIPDVTPYSINNAGFRVTSSFSGTWYPSRGSVVFSDTTVNLKVWGDEVFLDGILMGGGIHAVETDQVTGRLVSLGDPLSLSFNAVLPGSTVFSATVTTLEP